LAIVLLIIGRPAVPVRVVGNHAALVDVAVIFTPCNAVLFTLHGAASHGWTGNLPSISRVHFALTVADLCTLAQTHVVHFALYRRRSLLHPFAGAV
jgi:hypothetical protein